MARYKDTIIKRLLGAVAPWINLRMVFKPVSKLSCLSKLKCPIPLLSRSGVVYRVNCVNCSEFYVGMTSRRLKQRMSEHRDCTYSALHKHMLECGHEMTLSSPRIEASDPNTERLLVKEALIIKESGAYKSLNGNTGSTDMKLYCSIRLSEVFQNIDHWFWYCL